MSAAHVLGLHHELPFLGGLHLVEHSAHTHILMAFSWFLFTISSQTVVHRGPDQASRRYSVMFM